MKVLERILEGSIRKSVEMESKEEQQEFRKGRGTTDGMFALRKLVEKRLGVQGEMPLRFMELEKAYDAIPRAMVMASPRWMGMPEAEVKLVEGMYKGTKGRVLVGPWMSEEFSVNIGLRQGSALSALMFTMAMELVNRKVNVISFLEKMLYAEVWLLWWRVGWRCRNYWGSGRKHLGSIG